MKTTTISVQKNHSSKGGWIGYVFFYVNDKRHKRSAGVFPLKSDARKAAEQLSMELQKTSSGLIDISFSDYYQHWFNLYKRPKAKSSSTSYQYELIGKWILKFFNKKKIKDIHRSDYQEFLNWYGKSHSYESARKLKAVCHDCVGYALDDHIIEYDFTKRAEMVYNRDNTRKIDYLNQQELTTLKKAVISGLEHFNTSRYMILTAIYTGARKAEIQALTWHDIDFKNSTISINKNWDEKQKAFKPTKTESSNRTIKVNPKLLDYLADLKANDSTMVFQNCFNTIPTSNALLKCLRSIMEKAKIKKKNFNFHSLRHVHVAYLISQGIDIYAISKRLGHSNVTVTLKVYSYLIDEHKAKNDDLIVAKLDKI